MTLEHEAFLYGGIDHFLSVSAPYLTEGVLAGQAVVAVVREPRLGALRDALAAHAEKVEFYDADAFYRHPVRTLKSYQELMLATRPRTVRALAEPVWQGRTPRQTLEWARYESLINVAFADSGARALCVYDRRGLPEAIIDHARRTHPSVAGDGRTVAGHDYVDPVEFGARCDGGRALPRPPGADYHAITSADLHALRAFVGERAIRHGLPGQAAQHLVTAANEVATNALRHGSPPIGAWVWQDGPELLCEIGDNGLWHAGPLVGFIPPGSALEPGFGLWTVRLLVDLMELRTGWDGTFVRLHVQR
jgi:anti-sigma regulatory factor (Ser/Thr protein kinase)